MAITNCDDYSTSIQVPQFVKPQKLAGGCPEMNGIRPVMYTGGFCVVFPYKTKNAKYAVRCWHAQVEGAQERMKRISEFLSQQNLPYFVDFQYEEEGINTSKGVLPIIIMDWVDAQPLKKYIKNKIRNTSALNELAKNFMQMVKDLHNIGISHGDLQHGNIMVKSDGSLVLVDYDSLYVPSISGYSSVTNGLCGYQHPVRFSMTNVSPKADYFSELVIYTSIKALAKFPDLWEKLQMEDTDTMIFSKEDIESKGYSEIFSEISKDEYLAKLVNTLRDFLTKTSIEQLKPLEEVEPNYAENSEKESIKEQICSLLNGIDETAEVKNEKEWIESADLASISISEINRHLQVVLRLNKQYKEKKKREELVTGLSQQWNEHTYTPQKSTVDSTEMLKDLRSDWGHN